MGIFSARKTVGSFRLEYPSLTEVVVTDEIPEGGEVPYYLWFTFLYVGKLLFNYPNDGGRIVANHARLSLQGKAEQLDAAIVAGRIQTPPDSLEVPHGYTLLGCCSTNSLRLIPAGQSAIRWTYSAELFRKGENLLVDTHIARGYEDELHRASIDAALETAMLRSGNRGFAVAAAAMGFFHTISQYGAANYPATLTRAASAATFASFAVGTGELPV